MLVRARGWGLGRYALVAMLVVLAVGCEADPMESSYSTYDSAIRVGGLPAASVLVFPSDTAIRMTPHAARTRSYRSCEIASDGPCGLPACNGMISSGDEEVTAEQGTVRVACTAPGCTVESVREAGKPDAFLVRAQPGTTGTLEIDVTAPGVSERPLGYGDTIELTERTERAHASVAFQAAAEPTRLVALRPDFELPSVADGALAGTESIVCAALAAGAGAGQTVLLDSGDFEPVFRVADGRTLAPVEPAYDAGGLAIRCARWNKTAANSHLTIESDQRRLELDLPVVSVESVESVRPVRLDVTEAPAKVQLTRGSGHWADTLELIDFDFATPFFEEPLVPQPCAAAVPFALRFRAGDVEGYWPMAFTQRSQELVSELEAPVSPARVDPHTSDRFTRYWRVRTEHPGGVMQLLTPRGELDPLPIELTVADPSTCP